MYVDNRIPVDQNRSSSKRGRYQRRTRLVSLFGAVALAAAACGSAAEVAGSSAETATNQTTEAAPAAEAGSGEEAGQEAVPASLLSGEFETIAGSSIDLASLQGEDVVLWFWAPW